MLKYKPGDKVVVNKDMDYPPNLVQRLKELNYILTIEKTAGRCYTMEEIGYLWGDQYIEKLHEEFIDEYDPIESRFDILDIRV